MFYVIFFIGVLLISIALLALRKRKGDGLEKAMKVILILYMVLALLHLLLPDGISWRAGNEGESFYESGEYIPYVLLRWINDVAFLVLPIAIFYHRKSFSRIAVFILSFSCLLNGAFFSQYMAFVNNGHGEGIASWRFFSSETKAFFYNLNFRSIYFALLLLLEWCLIFYLLLRDFKELKFKGKVEVRDFFLLLFASLFSSMPIYAPSYLFCGYPLEKDLSYFTFGSLMQFVWIAWLFIKGIGIYLYFRHRSEEDQHLVILFLTLALVIQFNGIFTCFGEITTQRMPFQLCNFADIIMLLLILTKKKIFYIFALTSNVLGVLFAVALCDSSNASIVYIMNVHYIVEHTQVILIPLLSFAFHLFGDLEKKDVRLAIEGFTLYFALIFLLGGTFWGIRDLVPEEYQSFFECNYMFMFNEESTASMVGFTRYLFEIKTKLFSFFPVNLMEPVVYVVFTLLSVGFFYIFYGIEQLRKRRKAKAN